MQFTEVERLLKYSMNSGSAYTHKSVEWPALYPNWLFVVQRYSSSLHKITFSNTLDMTHVYSNSKISLSIIKYKGNHFQCTDNFDTFHFFKTLILPIFYFHHEVCANAITLIMQS